MFDIAYNLMIVGMTLSVVVPVIGFAFFGKTEGNEFRSTRLKG